MEENNIIVKDYSAVSSDVALLAYNKLTSAKETQYNGVVDSEDNSHKIWVDPRCCYSLYSKLNSDQVLLQQSPLALPKSLKVIYVFLACLISVKEESFAFLTYVLLIVLLSILRIGVYWQLNSLILPLYYRIL